MNTAYLGEKWNVDLQAGIQADAWSIMLYANNLLDDDVPTWAQIANDLHDGMYGGAQGGQPRDDVILAYLPQPRTVGIRANLKFGNY